MTFPKYHKINSVFKRDMTKKNKPLILGDFTLPEFEYLKDLPWEFSEKIDGTNIRVLWDGNDVTIGGRTDNAQIPAPLIPVITKLFNKDKLREVFGDKKVVFFGEGYGGKIQSGGNYSPTETFACFDILIGGFWLQRASIISLCKQLDIDHVPYFDDRMTLSLMIECLSLGVSVGCFNSDYSRDSNPFQAEGVVGTPLGDFLCRNGDRVIVKIKCCDFKGE